MSKSGASRRLAPSWRSLIVQIVVVAGLVVAAVIAQVAYDLWRSYDRQIADAKRNSANLVHLLEEQTARTFQSVELTLHVAADAVRQLPAGRPDYDESVHRLLGSFIAQVPFVRAIFLVDRDGIMRHLSNRLPSPPLDHTHRDYFRTLQTGEWNGLFVGSPILSRTTGLWFISASLRLEDAAGNFAGVITAVVEPEYFQAFYKSIDVGREGSLAMFLRDGSLLVRSPRNDEWIGKSFADLLLFRDLLAVAPHGIFEAETLEGKAGIISYRTIDDLRLVLTVALSERETLQDWRANLYVYVPILAGFICFVVVLLWFLLRELREREHLALALRGSNERLRMALESSETGIWTWDRANDTSIADDNVMRMFGVDPDAYGGTGESFFAYVHPDDREKVRAAVDRCMAGEESYDVVYRIQRVDGAVRWIHSRGEAVRDERGVATGMIGVCNDSTTQRQSEESLLQAQRMEVVSQLTGGVAHDFNNLLQVVLGNAEILMDGLAGNPVLRRWAEMTKVAAERGAELTRRLLAFARRQALEPSEVQVNRLLLDMSDTLRRTLGDIHLIVDLDESLWMAHVDSVQLENAIINLVLNARDAMPAGGRLLLATGNRELSEQDCAAVAELSPGRYVVVSVADGGTGMTPQVLKRCCEPFFTTKAVGKGSGLGLSMVYGFIKQSHGHLTIASKPDDGTMVTLYLPWAGMVPPELAQPMLPPRGAVPGGIETVLVVDDEPLVRGYVCQQVANLGYAVIECADGPAALARLRQEETVDLLFTDILMPGGMDGVALAEEARRLRPGLKVLLTSGDARGAAPDQERLMAYDLLEKPYRKEELAERLRSILDCPD